MSREIVADWEEVGVSRTVPIINELFRQDAVHTRILPNDLLALLVACAQQESSDRRGGATSLGTMGVWCAP